jgi:hypothetical protein
MHGSMNTKFNLPVVHVGFNVLKYTGKFNITVNSNACTLISSEKNILTNTLYCVNMFCFELLKVFNEFYEITVKLLYEVLSQPKDCARYRNFPGSTKLCPMCVNAYLETTWTDINI